MLQLARWGWRAGQRGLATASFSKFGRASEVVSLAADTEIKALGDKEVALKFLAASITSHDLQMIQGNSSMSLPAIPGSEGVAVVTAVGSSVSGLKVNDWVVPAVPAFGKWVENFASSQARWSSCFSFVVVFLTFSVAKTKVWNRLLS